MRPVEQFKYDDKNPFTPAPLSLLAPGTIMAGAGLGFALSVLIFMDQNISAAMVNSPSNRSVSLTYTTRPHCWTRFSTWTHVVFKNGNRCRWQHVRHL